MKRFAAVLLSSVFVFGAALHALEPDPDNGALTLPEGFGAVVVADDLGPLRFLTVAPNGDIYVKTRRGGIFGLRDTNGDGKADLKQEFGEGGGTGIALRGDWLYHSSTDAVYRVKLTPGELVPSGKHEVVVRDLPDKRQHNSKVIAFDGEDRLYVEVGSPSNALGQPDRAPGAKGQDPTEFLSKHGGFWRFDPDKLNQTQADGFHFSTGHRHVLSVAWNDVSKALFVVQMGRDQLNTVAPRHYTEKDNAERVAEEMHVLREGANLGWPRTYYDPLKKARMLAPEYGGDNEKQAEAGKWPDPLVAFPAHWAPMQMSFYRSEQFPEKYRGGAFVAFHGSWNRSPLPQAGYCIAFVPFDEKGTPRGEYEVFASGFAGREDPRSPRQAEHRPCGLAVGPDGSLYVSDSVKGRVWRIFYKAGARSKPQSSGKTALLATNTTPVSASGAQLYAQHCSTCHMADGSGVPNLQPELIESAVVTGEPSQLIRLLLAGPERVLPPDRVRYNNTMPSFAQLSDQEVSAVLTYIRQQFGSNAPAITAPQVAAERKASGSALPESS